MWINAGRGEGAGIPHGTRVGRNPVWIHAGMPKPRSGEGKLRQEHPRSSPLNLPGFPGSLERFGDSPDMSCPLPR